MFMYVCLILLNSALIPKFHLELRWPYNVGVVVWCGVGVGTFSLWRRPFIPLSVWPSVPLSHCLKSELSIVSLWLVIYGYFMYVHCFYNCSGTGPLLVALWLGPMGWPHWVAPRGAPRVHQGCPWVPKGALGYQMLGHFLPVCSQKVWRSLKSFILKCVYGGESQKANPACHTILCDNILCPYFNFLSQESFCSWFISCLYNCQNMLFKLL